MRAVRQGSQTFVIIAGLQLAAVLAWAQTATSLPQDQLNPTGAPTSNVLQLPQSSVFPQPASTNKATPISLTLADAIARARANNPAFQAALVRFGLARQDSMIARSTLLPGVDFNNTYLYTQGNGTLSGRFVANNGVHEYLDQGVVQQSMG
ncbi:MAG: TolC family protein, partial [Candidatus Korobacteraceae bacterium]